MRNGSAILWLLVVGLVAFILFNVVSGVNVKQMFQLPYATSSYNSYTPPPQAVAQPPLVVSNPALQPGVVPPIGFNANQLSPFYKQVHIDSVIHPDRNAYYTSAGGQFALYTDWSIKQLIDVTGWSVRGNKGSSISIPQAVVDYNPNTFSTLQNTDIVLESGARVYVYGSRGPLGSNFRLNKCTGYLNENNTFNPNLPNECPRVDSARLVLLSGKCQDFVHAMNTCVTPKPDALNQISGFVEDECRALIAKQNHVACYNDNHNAPDFFSKEWRVWNGDAMTFDTYHDRLMLFDKQGLLVDTYTY